MHLDWNESIKWIIFSSVDPIYDNMYDINVLYCAHIIERETFCYRN